MFRDVPECSGMFHVPDFIDGHSKVLPKSLDDTRHCPANERDTVDINDTNRMNT